MSYKLSNENWVLRISDNARIPMVEGNPEYQKYLDYLAAGNTPIPADSDTISKRTQFLPQEYFDLFTTEEQTAVVQATLQNADVKLWYDRMLMSSYIDLEDPRTIAGLEAIVSAGLLTPERKVEILN